MLNVPVTLRTRGSAAPDTAWERYADLRQWSDWSPQITGVEAASMVLQPGLTGRVVGPLGIRVPFEVLSVGDRRWTWEVRPPGLRLRLEHGVEADGEGSATWLRMRGPAPVVLGYAPLALLALRRLVAR